MTWQTTYPTVATVQAANFETIHTWLDNLPAPQTDVERTVHRRLIARHTELAAQQLRTHHPTIADAYNKLGDTLERIVGARPMPRM
jgi:hypothetical protein